MHALVIITALAVLAACGGGEERSSKVTKIAFVTDGIVDGEIPLTKDGSTLVGVEAQNPDGNRVDVNADDFEWKLDNAAVELRSLGNAAVVTGMKDWFDSIELGAFFEPSSILNVRYNELQLSVIISVVLDARGEWTVVIEGEGRQDLLLTQSGRDVQQFGTTAENVGTVIDNQFVLNAQGYQLVGTFTTRTEASGIYIDPFGGTGNWTATKQP